MQEVKIGDVVAWDKVPSGALVRCGRHCPAYYVRLNDRGTLVCADEEWGALEGSHGYSWPWVFWQRNADYRVTIIALGLTGSESADDLRRIAEVFEVRDFLDWATASGEGLWRLDEAPPAVFLYFSRGQQITVAELKSDDATEADALNAAAERLHAAGWRPGDSAERAVELLTAAAEETRE